jgi:hypothetical protein
VAPGAGSRRADPHQAVDPVLAAGSRRRRPLDQQRGALDPGLLAGCSSITLDREAAALRPAQVHALQHLRPVLRLGAAGAGVDGRGPSRVKCQRSSSRQREDRQHMHRPAPATAAGRRGEIRPQPPAPEHPLLEHAEVGHRAVGPDHGGDAGDRGPQQRRRFSAARKRAARKCCQGAVVSPYQASLVIVTSTVAPPGSGPPPHPGKRPRSRSPFRAAPRPRAAARAPAGRKLPAFRGRSCPESQRRRGSGTYSPNGTRCRLS